MDPQNYWNLFGKLGEVEVRKRLAAQNFNPDEQHYARQWLEYQAALVSADERKRTIAAAAQATEAADRARAVADGAAKAVARANMVAILSLVCATLAILIAAASVVLVR